MKRAVDVVVSALALLLLSPLFAFAALLVKLTSNGPVIHWSQRVGADNDIFPMPKLRTMWVDTPSVASHLVADPSLVLTPVGGFLRRSSLDEIPQLWSVLSGKMSLVGPRPALFNQDDLIALRTAAGVHRLRPGVTGWAQINGRDEISIERKVEFDVEYLKRRSMRFDLQILWKTLERVSRRSGVKH